MKTIVVSVVIAAALLPGCRSSNRDRTPPDKPSAAKEGRAAVTSLHHERVYAYSVVAGGVRCVEEVREVMSRDPEVAAHYSDLNIAALRGRRTDSPIEAYVSYRKNGRVYWTSRKVRIPAGERVMTDGRNCLRERCGNRISPGPMRPVADRTRKMEPAWPQLDGLTVRGHSIDELPMPPVLGGWSPEGVAPQAMVIETVASSRTPSIGGGGAIGSSAGGSGAGLSPGGAPGTPGDGSSENWIPAPLYPGGPIVFIEWTVVPALLPLPTTPIPTEPVPGASAPVTTSPTAAVYTASPWTSSDAPASAPSEYAMTIASPSIPSSSSTRVQPLPVQRRAPGFGGNPPSPNCANSIAAAIPSNGDQPNGLPAADLPEPGTSLLIGLGLLCLGATRRLARRTD